MKIGYSEQKISSGSGDSANGVCASEVPVFCVDCPIYTGKGMAVLVCGRAKYKK